MSSTDDITPLGYPGQRLGRPRRGAGSVAGWGRRLLALLIDWTASRLVVAAFLGTGAWSGQRAEVWTLLVLLVELTLLTGLLGASLGQRLLGIRVVTLDGQPPGLPRAALRSFLICLLLPPLVFDRDWRGLHDLAAGTVVIRR